MVSGKIEHLVIVRHGESEGDVRRAAIRAGHPIELTKSPTEEDETVKGAEQSAAAGRWITKHVLRAYNMESFDLYLRSPLKRTRQSSESLQLPNAHWQDEPLLAERDRGLIRGLAKEAHKQRFPESYKQMVCDPLHWTPPHGESIMDVVARIERLFVKIRPIRGVILETHRDLIWAAHAPIEGLSESQLAVVNTDAIENGQVIHCMSINPYTSKHETSLLWKRSVSPWRDGIAEPGQWVDLRHTGGQHPAELAA